MLHEFSQDKHEPFWTLSTCDKMYGRVMGTCGITYESRHKYSLSHTAHGGDQTRFFGIFRLDSFLVHSFERRGLPFTSMKNCLKFLGLPWKLVWKWRGLPWQLDEILAVLIILSPISCVCGLMCDTSVHSCVTLSMCDKSHRWVMGRCLYVV